VHEAVQVGGFGAELAAQISETMFSELSAPIARLGAPRTPIAYAPQLEAQVTICAAQIEARIRKILALSF
jgi:pyruvate dehydrogenase E1 component beta subunit